jgi:hypothetical protein
VYAAAPTQRFVLVARARSDRIATAIHAAKAAIAGRVGMSRGRTSIEHAEHSCSEVPKTLHPVRRVRRRTAAGRQPPSLRARRSLWSIGRPCRWHHGAPGSRSVAGTVTSMGRECSAGCPCGGIPCWTSSARRGRSTRTDHCVSCKSCELAEGARMTTDRPSGRALWTPLTTGACLGLVIAVASLALNLSPAVHQALFILGIVLALGITSSLRRRSATGGAGRGRRPRNPRP